MVGVDGSACGTDAALWAADDARRRGLGLQLVHAAVKPLRDAAGRGRPPDEEALRMLEETAALVGKEAPEVAVSSRLVFGDASAALGEAAAGAALLVIGKRGRGGFSELLLGSTAYQVAGDAPCPIAVVPEGQGNPREPGEVVVGVDASAHSARAAAFGYTEAAVRGGRLRLVHVLGDGDDTRSAGDSLPQMIGRTLADVLPSPRDARANVEIIEETRQGSPAAVLADSATGAALLVVGSRGHGGFRGLALGSVSHPLLHHAPCPLVAVR
nr:universal stress protein [Actinomadura rugatobispora]